MLATLAAVALASAAGAASKEPVCTAAKEGTLGTVTATRRIGTRPGFTVSVSVSRDANEETVITRLLIRRGRATVLDVVTRIPPGGAAETRAHFAKGYKGVHDVLVQPKGVQYVAVVDGRETAPFTPGVAAEQVHFPDGGSLPTVRVGRAVKRLLKRITRLGTPPCLAGGEIAPAAAAIRPAATCRTDTLANCETFPGCDGCVLACGLRGYACMAKALLCGPFCFFVGGIDCNAEAAQCSAACRAPTQPCCPVGCPFRGSSSYKCFGAGNVCCEWDANGIPEGCAQDECCGPDGQKTCCSNGYECTGPYSLCCPRGEPAAVCPGQDQCCPSGLACEPGSLGRNTCCAPGSSACGVDADLNDLCCPDGKCCGADELTRTCCGPAGRCVDGGRCCRPENGRGTCCAAEGVRRSVLRSADAMLQRELLPGAGLHLRRRRLLPEQPGLRHHLLSRRLRVHEPRDRHVPGLPGGRDAVRLRQRGAALLPAGHHLLRQRELLRRERAVLRLQAGARMLHVVRELKAVGAVLALLAGAALTGPARAATITVTTTADELDTNGTCSLREAIRAANTDDAVDESAAGAGADEIVVPAGVYQLAIPGPAEDAALTGDLDITGDLVITGAGAASTIIDGGGLDRVFHVDPRGDRIAVTIRGVTIQNGRVSPIPFVAATGGGVLLGATNTLGGTIPSGSLTLGGSIVRGSTAAGTGGGVANRGGTLTLVDSTVRDNRASTGGGIYNEQSSTTHLLRSTVRDNGAVAEFSSGGGGICSFGDELTVVDSTVSGNIVNTTTGTQGGGIAIYAGVLHLLNATVSGNRTGPPPGGRGGSGGGGIYVQGGGAHTIASSTITDNAATGTAGV